VIRGSEQPQRAPGLFLPRGDLPAQVLADLRARGAAVLSGPAGAGSSWAGLEVAEGWTGGPVVWSRAGLWTEAADLLRPLWDGEAPAPVHAGSRDALVDAALAQVRETRALFVFDDCDEALEPPPSRASARDPDLEAFLRAVGGGALAGSGAALLACGRRAPEGLALPVRPLPPLSAEDGARLAGPNAGSGLPASWLRRPGALSLLAHAGPDFDVQAAGDSDPWPALVLAVSERLPAPEDREMLVALSAARHPVPADALAEAAGLAPEAAAAALLRLLNAGLALLQAGGWRSPRAVSAAVREVLPERLPGVLPRALEQRLAGALLRSAQDPEGRWESADEARPARLGIRHAAAAADPRMALHGALYASSASALERLGAWRALRSDLRVALAAPAGGAESGEEAPPDLDRARAFHGVARVSALLADHEAEQDATLRALPLAEGGGDPALLSALHARIGRRHLLAGDLDKARAHLERALVAATAAGDRVAQCDLENQLGGSSLQSGDLDDAERRFRRSLELALELGDARRAASREAGLAGVVLGRGDLREAETLLLRAAESGRGEGDRTGVAQRLLNVAFVRSLRGDAHGAMSALGQLVAEGAPEDPRSLCRLLAFRANLRRLGGDLDGARRDLEAAAEPAVQAGDRELVGELRSAWGHLFRTTGDFDAAVDALEAAVEALAGSREDSVRAAREAELWNARAWRCAAACVAGDNASLRALLRASSELEALMARIPRRPFHPRWYAARSLALEASLMGAALAGTAPIGTARHLERLHAEACAEPENVETGEPALRLLHGWALLLCGDGDAAETLLRRAVADAAPAGLQTVRGRALALLGEAFPSWNGQARLLRDLLRRGVS
jgi:tetratricopeptide (TPR) repeat protein